MKSIDENDSNLNFTAKSREKQLKCTQNESHEKSDHNHELGHNCTKATDSHSDDLDSDSIPVPPPDGGFGWIIVFASFMCNVIVDGIIFSFGILLLEISREFGESKARTAWIGSLQAGFYLIIGPVVSALANVFGCRRTTIFGSILATTGFVISFFAENVETLYITFGLLSGIGFGFVFLPAIVTVGFYFEKRRAFATGIAVCGSGIGAFMLAPVTQYLVDLFGWRGCVLILAGITLNCAVFGSLFRPVEHLRHSQSQKPLLLRIKEARDALWTESDDEIDEISPTASQNSAPPPYSTIVDIVPETPNNGLLAVDSQLLKESLQRSKDELRNRRRTQSYSTGPEPRVPRAASQEILYSAMSLIVMRNRSASRVSQSSHASRILDRSTKLSSIKSVNESSQSKSSPSQELSHSKQSLSSVETNAIDGSPDADPDSKTCFPASVTEMFDLTLLASPSFLLLSLSGFLCLVGFFIPFMYIADRATLLGCTPEKSAFLLSMIGITNTIGRVFCGYISDRPAVNALLINNVALTIGGLVTIAMPIVCHTYTSLIVYTAIFGFSIACFAALRSVITVELLGLDRLTSAFGLLLLFQGIAVTIGSPIAGWFFDITGSYDFSFYLSGSAIALSGIMCFPLSAISRWERRKPGFGAIN